MSDPAHPGNKLEHLTRTRPLSLVPGRTFQPSLVLASDVSAYLSEDVSAYLSEATFM
jgi:hypothetical protein